MTSGTQKRQRKADLKAKAAAKAKVSEVASDIKGKRNQHLSITKEQIIAERTNNGNTRSWKQVAINLGLGSPTAARSAWEKLTGSPHDTAPGKKTKAKKGTVSVSRKTHTLQWDDTDLDEDELDALQETVEDVLPHKSIRVQRVISKEDEIVRVRKVKGFRFDGKGQDGPLVVIIIEDSTGAFRSFRVRDILETL